MIRILHLNSLGCDITDTELNCTSYEDPLDTNDKVVEYLSVCQIDPGDTLKIIED